MSFTVPLPPRTQLYNRSCSNKHTRGLGTDSDSRFPTLIIYVRMCVCVCDVCLPCIWGCCCCQFILFGPMGRLVHIGLGSLTSSQSLVTHVLQSPPPPPPREQLCNRYYSHKHTHLHGVRHGNCISCSPCVCVCVRVCMYMQHGDKRESE
jgi:hypothetical protein